MMQREPEFYAGVTCRFRLWSQQHKQVNLMLRALDVRAPACTQFCGAVRDGCTGVYLDNVYVSVRYGAFQCCGYTNACGQFCFLVPCPAGAVSIALWKPGYSKHTIGAYPVNEACHHSFRLYPTV